MSFCLHLGEYFDLPEGHKWEEVEMELGTDTETEVCSSWSGCRSNTREYSHQIVTGEKAYISSDDNIEMEDLVALSKEFLLKPWACVEDMLDDFTEQLNE
jgi:hypothetical protein